MSGRRVAVTGGTGHPGPNLVRGLVERGDRVRVLVHRDSAPDGGPGALDGVDVERCAGDVGDIESLRRCFADAELVFHLAACISITGDQGGRVTRTNVDGSRNSAEVAREAGVGRFVHVIGPRHAAYDRSKA